MSRPSRAIGWATLGVGAWVVMNGIGHIVGSVNVALREGKPYDFRYASLMFLGLSLIFAGALIAASARGVDARRPSATLLAGASALFVVGTVAIYLPILPALGVGALNVALLAWLAIDARARRAPPVDGS